MNRKTQIGDTACVQVECRPDGPIVVRVATYRPTAGGFLSLSLFNVAGSGAISGVELRSSPSVSAAGHRRV